MSIEINNKTNLGNFLFGCRQFNIGDLVQYSQKNTFGKALFALKLLFSGKGIFFKERAEKLLLNHSEINKILKEFPQLNTIKKTDHVAKGALTELPVVLESRPQDLIVSITLPQRNGDNEQTPAPSDTNKPRTEQKSVSENKSGTDLPSDPESVEQDLNASITLPKDEDEQTPASTVPVEPQPENKTDTEALPQPTPPVADETKVDPQPKTETTQVVVDSLSEVPQPTPPVADETKTDPQPKTNTAVVTDQPQQTKVANPTDLVKTQADENPLDSNTTKEASKEAKEKEANTETKEENLTLKPQEVQVVSTTAEAKETLVYEVIWTSTIQSSTVKNFEAATKLKSWTMNKNEFSFQVGEKKYNIDKRGTHAIYVNEKGEFLVKTISEEKNSSPVDRAKNVFLSLFN